MAVIGDYLLLLLLSLAGTRWRFITAAIPNIDLFIKLSMPSFYDGRKYYDDLTFFGLSFRSRDWSYCTRRRKMAARCPTWRGRCRRSARRWKISFGYVIIVSSVRWSIFLSSLFLSKAMEKTFSPKPWRRLFLSKAMEKTFSLQSHGEDSKCPFYFVRRSAMRPSTTATIRSWNRTCRRRCAVSRRRPRRWKRPRIWSRCGLNLDFSYLMLKFFFFFQMELFNAEFFLSILRLIPTPSKHAVFWSMAHGAFSRAPARCCCALTSRKCGRSFASARRCWITWPSRKSSRPWKTSSSLSRFLFFLTPVCLLCDFFRKFSFFHSPYLYVSLFWAGLEPRVWPKSPCLLCDFFRKFSFFHSPYLYVSLFWAGLEPRVWPKSPCVFCDFFRKFSFFHSLYFYLSLFWTGFEPLVWPKSPCVFCVIFSRNFHFFTVLICMCPCSGQDLSPCLTKVSHEVDARQKELTHQPHREILIRCLDSVKSLAPILICSMKIFIQILQQGGWSAFFSPVLLSLQFSHVGKKTLFYLQEARVLRRLPRTGIIWPNAWRMKSTKLSAFSSWQPTMKTSGMPMIWPSCGKHSYVLTEYFVSLRSIDRLIDW